ncbi:hypothetical protein PUR30_14765, partial [Streptomyces sp. JV190]|nr:hypothetical protein [Streptomyces sp. JV190]
VTTVPADLAAKTTVVATGGTTADPPVEAVAVASVATTTAAVDTAGSGTIVVAGEYTVGATTVVGTSVGTTGTASPSSGFRSPMTSRETRSTRTCVRSC